MFQFYSSRNSLDVAHAGDHAELKRYSSLRGKQRRHQLPRAHGRHVICNAHEFRTCPFLPEPQRRLILLVSPAVPLSNAITLVHPGPAHCSSNLCQGGSSLASVLAVYSADPLALLLPIIPFPPFLFLFLLLFARRALNYGGNATKSSRLIELLLESRRAAFTLRKKEEKMEEKKDKALPPLTAAPPFILFFVRPSLAGIISRRREFPGNNFECVRLPARSRARGELESVDRTRPKLGLSFEDSSIVSPSSISDILITRLCKLSLF